jgi:hypothetical protein
MTSLAMKLADLLQDFPLVTLPAGKLMSVPVDTSRSVQPMSEDAKSDLAIQRGKGKVTFAVRRRYQ